MSIELVAALLIAALGFFFGRKVEVGKRLRRSKRVDAAVQKARADMEDATDEEVVDLLTRHSVNRVRPR